MWRIEWEDAAGKELRKLDYTAQDQILSYLENRIATEEDPRRFGEGLSADKVGLWRYRVSNFIAALIAYTYQDKKPSLNLTTEDLNSIQEAHFFPPEPLALTII